MRIGMYGGTFNPIHNGHIIAATAAAESLKLDKLLIIPTDQPPHKNMPEKSASAAQRMAMTQIAAREIPGAEASDIEIKRSGKSYSADTVSELKDMYPGDEIYLLMGTDMLLSFEKWYRFEDILKSAKLAVFARSIDDNEKIKKATEELKEKYGASVIIIKNDHVVNISSSDIREELKNREGCGYLPRDIYGFIVKNHLYGVNVNYEWLHEESYAMLKPKRVPHVKGCEEEAVKLAARWGCDEDKARMAAILHDCTKKLTLPEQLILCKEYGIMTDEVERTSEKLLHAKTGASVARDVFGMDEDVCNAILWHTTGRENMSLLEKIIYMADYIEPTRDFAGLSELRRLAYENLDKSLILGLEMSLEDMKAGGIVPHERSIAALEYLKRDNF